MVSTPMVIYYLSILSILNSSPFSLIFDSVYVRYRLETESSATQIYTPYSTPSDGDLMMSGTKSFTVNVGDEGGGLEQGMNVNFTGKISGARIEGNFSDQGVPAETKGITEIDKMKFGVYAQRFGAELGDLDIQYPFGVVRSMGGGLVSFKDDPHQARAVYGQSKGRFTTISFNGVEGKQGPYFLSRAGQIIPESEKIFLNGAQLVRGDDYYIDYEMASLTFTTKHLITNRSRIEADFQYGDYDYPLILNSVDGYFAPGRVNLGLFIFREYNDKNAPLFFDLTPAEKFNLQQIGDDSTRAFRSGADSTAGDYIKVDDHFLYVGGDSGDYKVTFSYVGPGQGDYRYDRSIHAYRYMGTGLGEYLPRIYIPLPKKSEFAGVQLGYREMVDLKYYRSRHDRNLFSSEDDNDNTGQGFDGEFNLKKKIYYLKVNQMVLGPNLFIPGRKYEVDHCYRYNLSQDEVRTKSEFAAGLQPMNFLRLNSEYGLINNEYKRIASALNFYALDLGFEFLNLLHRYQIGLDTSTKWLNINCRFLEERYDWREDYMWTSTNQFVLKFLSPLIFNLGYTYEDDTTGISRTKQGGFSISDIFEANLGIRNFINDRYIFASSRVHIVTRYFTTNGFFERTNSLIQKLDEVFRKVEPGRGNYVQDPVTREFIPKPRGDYIREFIRLEEFERVDAYRYSIDFYSMPFEVLEIRTAVDGSDEKLYRERNISPILTLQPGADFTFNLFGQNRRVADERYYGATETKNDQVGFEPSYRGLGGHFEYLRDIQLQDRHTIELKKGWKNWLLQNFRLKLDWWLKGGYNYMVVEMPYYYPELGYFHLYEPNCGAGVAYPLQNSGRIDLGAEFLYRFADIARLPFSIAIESPPGLTQNYNLNGSYNLNDWTVIFARYYAEKRPGEKITYNLRAELKIRF